MLSSRLTWPARRTTGSSPRLVVSLGRLTRVTSRCAASFSSTTVPLLTDSALLQLKALSGASTFASSQSETRKSSSSVDLPALLRWMDSLTELVANFEAEAAAKASEMASPEKGPSDVEYDMLEQERDLLAAEVTALKAELTMVSLVQYPGDEAMVLMPIAAARRRRSLAASDAG